MTMSTAGTKSRPTSRRPSDSQILVGQTFRKLQLTAGLRPFAVVAVDVERDTVSGWLLLDPTADSEDPFLKEQGIQAADRKRPCYITVPTDMLK